MNYSKEDIDKIEKAATLFDTISDTVKLSRQGASYYGKCPMCNKDGKGKGIILTPAKNIYKCFSCDFAGNSPVKFAMDVKNKTYPEALKYLADLFNVLLSENQNTALKPQKKKKPASLQKIKSFRDIQLEQSGLTDEDTRALVYVDDKTRKLKDVYQSATRDQYGQIVAGDDMIIWYYDLEGKPVMFQRPKSNRFEHLFRVRWQNPDLHLDREGRPIKYQSPSGSGSHIYIPEAVRRAFQAKLQQRRLYIQEGEKKADKACKHGLFSVGIMGIHNIAYNKQLPYEIQLIIKTLDIKEVVFVIDADWCSISNNIKPGDNVDQRPYSFYRAVLNFRDYFKTFTNIGIYLEIYFAHIQPNANNDKGIDDLLNNTLKGKEDTLFEDITKTLNEKDGDGEFLKFYKISTAPEMKLLELWYLNDPKKFAETHKDKLIDIPEFKINRLKWRFDKEGNLELAQPLMPEETYWEFKESFRGEKTIVSYHFNPKRCYTFLRNRGFGRLMLDGKFVFVFQQNHVINVVDSYYIKDYIIEFTETIAPEDVQNMLYRGGKMYFGQDSLSNLKYINCELEKSDRFSQSLYFKGKFWQINIEGIKEKLLTELNCDIWSDRINNFEAHKLKKPLLDIIKIDDAVLEKFSDSNRKNFEAHKNGFFVEFSKDAENCHFLKFLWNTGEFYWDKIVYDSERNIIQDNRSLDEKMETNIHLVSKMSAIGYLLHRYNNKSEAVAIIGVDGKLSEVGSSNGRTGKSLVGFALGYAVPQVYIPGKSRLLTEDRFIFEEVNEKTCLLFIDDVRAKIDFEFFFPFLGGKAVIEKKTIGKYTLPDDQKPKLYISTNHSIEGEGPSFRARQFYIAFSDYYNDKHQPIQDFGVQFFDEWDPTQWNLFYNFMGECLHIYFKYGLVKQPLERIEKRRLRQEIGEEFFSWADEYFSIENESDARANINNAIQRKVLYDNFLESNQAFKKWYTPNTFKKKFKKWCTYWKLQFNPHRFDKNNQPGADDKSNGIEYFTVSNEPYNI